MRHFDVLCVCVLGSVRTNCVDCLDRTNVLQSLVARQVVQTQLRVLGLLTPDQRVEDQTVFEYNFKNIWADNADFVSTHVHNKRERERAS